VISIGTNKIQIFSKKKLASVPWHDEGIDILIDASGVKANVLDGREIVADGKVKKIIVTHSPLEGVDKYLILGINDEEYDESTHHIVSSSICDANAIAHPLHALEREFGIENGFVTTLHPWLSYQNLVDGPVPLQLVPGRYFSDYALGRSSTGTLIPKTTTAVEALQPIMKETEAKLHGVSFRVPTQIVSTADITVKLNTTTSDNQLAEFFESIYQNSRYVEINNEPLVGTDYIASPYSAILDSRWTKSLGNGMIKVILWYDNEWGYSCRVIDMARMMAEHF
jgi:glyceraldehyde-3-phosphate dehydrogenase type I